MDILRKKSENNPDVKNALGLKLKYKYKRWDNDEIAKFIEAVKKYGKNPPLISKHVGTKSL